MNQVLCLIYHRVKEVDNDIYHIAVQPDVFERQIRFIKDNYRIVRFEDDWKSIEGDKAIAITFDDGYWDNYETAFPILEKQQVPATFFLSAGHIGTEKEFWWDRLTTLLSREIPYPATFTLEDALYHYTWRTGTKAERLELAKSLRYLLRMERNDLLFQNWCCQLERWCGRPYLADSANRLMTWEDARVMSKSPYVTIGGHTMEHYSLGALSDERQREEVCGSVRKIEEELGKPITVFSYPFGGRMDYNNVTMDLLRECGVSKAATTRAAAWHGVEHEYEIPRLTVKNWDIEELQEKIEGCFL